MWVLRTRVGSLSSALEPPPNITCKRAAVLILVVPKSSGLAGSTDLVFKWTGSASAACPALRAAATAELCQKGLPHALSNALAAFRD